MRRLFNSLIALVMIASLLFISGCYSIEQEMKDDNDRRYTRGTEIKVKDNPIANDGRVTSLREIKKPLISFKEVADYIVANGNLPDNFITKAQAKRLGWNSSKGNLALIAPGKSIGGDIFTNREKVLPDANGRIWYEADIDYRLGFRNGKRILYSNDGLVYKTIDHYKTFQRIY